MALNFKMPSFKVNNNNILPQTNAKLSNFDLSENLTTGIKTDYVYPVYWRELQPNDHFEINVSSLARIMPLVAPPMDRMKLKFMAFWVPNRTIWKHWVNFMGEVTYQGDDKVIHRVPQINMNSAANVTNGLADYLGIQPTTTTCDYTVSALPFRAYYKIWNEWIRANYIQEEVKEFNGDTDELETLESYKLLKMGKQIDYFTSCLPQPEQVDISLGDSAPVIAKNKNGESVQFMVGNNREEYAAAIITNNVANQGELVFADMSKVTGLSINALSYSIAMQRMYQKDRRSGMRYIDLIKEHYACDVPDFLVGRSEFLGSEVVEINFETVVQSSESQTTPQGNLASLGFGAGNGKLCQFSAREHGHLMILATVESELTYQQGLDRKWEKRDRFDYYFPEFANLGEQPVFEREIMLTAENAKSSKVFGYVPRYREEREGYNKITGIMRSNVTDGFQSLDVWHLAQKFATPPQLNGEFIECKTPIDRALAVQGDIFILLNLYFDIKATRSIPIQSDPSIIPGRIGGF